MTAAMNPEPLDLPLTEFLALRDRAGWTLVDCREPWEWELVHLPGAVLLPLGELPHRHGELPKDRPVVVYCHHGVRSRHAAVFLRGQGLAARSLEGGIDRLAAEADPKLARY